ncbi:salicylate synthase [Actinocorallia aurantiaca]|uniref:Mycobactin biosynthesis salicylate synthase MbtI n=1 Tax=Actinocorallia aurantiaca TaxID=46204 RepID=A0ABP6GHJ5_9ACTN
MSIGVSTQIAVPVTADPVQLVARLARSGLFTDYVAYERPGSWRFAGGALGEVTLDAETVRLRWAERPESATSWSGDPARALGDALAEVPGSGWTAYGWIAFEFAGTPYTGRLAHLIVPRTEVRIEEGIAYLTGEEPDELNAVAKLLSENLPPEAPVPSPIDVRTGGEAYRENVARAVAEIEAGEYQKVIVSRRLPVPFPVDVIGTYLAGRAANTPARSFLLDVDGFRSTGFSPEVVAAVDENGVVTTQPLAGTRAFGLGSDTDSAHRRELQNDPKEIFEHAVSVRTSQEELYGVCEPGTVHVTDFMNIKERGSVQHLASRVTGRLAAGRTSWDALRALFPGVTASGIPKREAMDAIARMEEPRGLYAGAVLTVSDDGSLDAALVLRALYSQNGQSWLRAGAGVVSGSTPEREYEETCEKLSCIAPHVVGQ